MEILQVYQKKNPSYTRNRSISPVGVFVHSTGANNRMLKRYVDAEERLGKNQYNNHWNKTNATKSVHAFIGYDKNNEVIVAQTLPYDRACWGAGGGSKGSYNYDPHAYLQFEICQGSNTDADYYWKAITVAEEYCAYLCKLYGWTADNITSHAEAHKAGYASNHSDPISWMKHFGDDMDKFRSRVAMRLNGKETPVKAPEIVVEETPKEESKPAQSAKTEGKTVTIELKQLKKGSQGSQVKTLQRLLNALGYDCGEVDGIFGHRTDGAVNVFQADNKLDTDGIVGKNTWTKLLG